MGLGNGAVFKLVPEHFPKDTGTVTGLVGALGGLGGFFPPLLLGVFRDRLGVIWPGFLLLSRDRAAAARRQPARVPARRRRVDAVAVRRRRVRRSSASGPARGPRSSRATLAAAIVVGSRNLQHFDAALVGYTFATLFAAFGITLSLRDVAAAAADAHVLAARLAGVLLTPARSAANTRQPRPPRAASSSPPTASSSGAAGCAGSRTG